MESWLRILLVSVFCLAVGFVGGRYYSSGEESSCVEELNDILGTMEEKDKLFAKINAQNRELGRIAEAAIEKIDLIKEGCLLGHEVGSPKNK